jgi:serine/threonine protein kinase
VLFSNVLVWIATDTGKFKGSLVLSNGMIVETCKEPLKAFVTMHSIDKKSPLNVDFYFDQYFKLNVFQYSLSRAIFELPKSDSLSVNIPSKSSFFGNNKKEEVDSSVSLPFNVQIKHVINFNMEWQGDIEEQIKLLNKIGSGGFGTVYRAVHIESSIEMAAKLVAAKDEKQEQSIRKEIELLKILRHPNIVSYYGCAGPDRKGLLWILMDFCAAGSLSSIIGSLKKNGRCVFTEDMIGYILAQVLRALVHLHQKNVIHRDIKCGNVLLTAKGEVQLADFGVSKQIDLSHDTISKGIVGSAHWLPPEAIGNPKGDASQPRIAVGAKGDVWALGITAIEMAEGKPPNFDVPAVQAMIKTLNDPPPKLSESSKWSVEFQNFVSRCLIKNPDDRPSAAQMLQDPFVILHLVRPNSQILDPILSDLGLKGQPNERPSSPTPKSKTKGKTPPKDVSEMSVEESFLADHTIIVDDDEEENYSTVHTEKKQEEAENFNSELNSGDEFDMGDTTTYYSRSSA